MAIPGAVRCFDEPAVCDGSSEVELAGGGADDAQVLAGRLRDEALVGVVEAEPCLGLAGQMDDRIETARDRQHIALDAAAIAQQNALERWIAVGADDRLAAQNLDAIGVWRCASGRRSTIAATSMPAAARSTAES